MASFKRIPVIFCALAVVLIIISVSVGSCIVDTNKKAEADRQIAAAEQAKQDAKNEAKTRHENSINAILNLSSQGESEHHIDISNFYYQYPELPSGCEAVALTNQLKFYGYKPSKTEIADKYLPRDGENFRDAFVGDPYNEVDGVTILPPGLRTTANNYLLDQHSDYHAYDISKKNFEDLFAYIEHGHPVQIWVTMYMDVPGEITSTYGEDNFYINEHSLLLTGFNKNNDTVDVCCSLAGNVTYGLEQTKQVWNQIGKHALVLVKDSEGEAWAGYDQNN
ncbi:MAG: C39 family peptidase [Coriobacteriia bacterium]|nr:C39 family peptidase [Coriobacteriia bacterium]